MDGYQIKQCTELLGEINQTLEILQSQGKIRSYEMKFEKTPDGKGAFLFYEVFNALTGEIEFTFNRLYDYKTNEFFHVMQPLPYDTFCRDIEQLIVDIMNRYPNLTGLKGIVE